VEEAGEETEGARCGQSLPRRSRERSLSLLTMAGRLKHVASRRILVAALIGTALSLTVRAQRFLPPGEYVVEWTGPRGWRATAATLNGRDVLRAPFVVGDRNIADIVITVTNR